MSHTSAEEVETAEQPGRIGELWSKKEHGRQRRHLTSTSAPSPIWARLQFIDELFA